MPTSITIERLADLNAILGTYPGAAVYVTDSKELGEIALADKMHTEYEIIGGASPLTICRTWKTGNVVTYTVPSYRSLADHRYTTIDAALAAAARA